MTFIFIIVGFKFWSNPVHYNVCICGFTMTEYGRASRSSWTLWLEMCLPVYPVDRRRSKTLQSRRTWMKKRGRRRLPYMAHETIPGAVRSPVNRRSWQAIPAILIWLARAKRKIRRAAEKKSRGYHRGDRERTGIFLSVCLSVGRSVARPRPEIKTPWIIHRRARTQAIPRQAASVRAYPFLTTRCRKRIYTLRFWRLSRMKKST